MLHTRGALINITENAKRAIREILCKEVYLRLGVDNKGCSGSRYKMEVTSHKNKGDEIIDIGDNKGVLLDHKAVYTLIGTTLDHAEDETGSQFTYKNPNVKASCGCGSSFNIK